jgi:hypothetical protein
MWKVDVEEKTVTWCHPVTSSSDEIYRYENDKIYMLAMLQNAIGNMEEYLPKAYKLKKMLEEMEEES